ncbi:MAG: uroporphyrinogen-III synthase [Pseudomonadota bacterium]
MVKTLEQEGFSTFCEPLFSVKKISSGQKIPGKISAIIISSSNACDAIIDFGLPKDVKIFAVGKKSAQKLIEVGFKNVEFAPKNSAESLLNLIIESEENKSTPILYFHGSIVSLDFKKELEKSGFKVENILSYETQEMPNFSAELLQFIKNNSFDQVLLFSQNSAKIFFKLAAKHNLLEYFKDAQLLCLSEKILHDVRNYGFTNSATFDQFPILNNFYD